MRVPGVSDMTFGLNRRDYTGMQRIQENRSLVTPQGLPILGTVSEVRSSVDASKPAKMGTAEKGAGRDCKQSPAVPKYKG
jgi:hypothetical protein